MKTRKQIFFLNKPPDDPYLVKSTRRGTNFEPIILWVMPELTALVQYYYFPN